MLIFIVFMVIQLCCQFPSTKGITLPEGTRVTECYGSDTKLSVSCSSAKVAISGFYFGFKPLTPNCNDTNTCCIYDETTDCLQADISTSTVMDELSGQSSGLISTSNKVGETCSGVSTYNVLEYQCLNGDSIPEMCTPVNSTSAFGDPLYLWNRGYTTSGVLLTDTSCNCSVETSSHTSDITIYIIHMDLYDDPNNCQQSITVSDSSGTALNTFKCEAPEFNTIQSVTVQRPYISVSLENSYTAASGGKFWIGVEATEVSSSVTLNCPVKPIPDCGTPDNGTHSTFTNTGTEYGSTAAYNCSVGYVQQSNDTRRICLQNGQWNGTALICIYECGPLTNISNGTVSFSGTVTGDVATYTCNLGCTLFGGATRSCIDGGGWNGTDPYCFKDCEDLGKGEVTVVNTHSHVSITDIIYGSTATYTCDDNYSHLSGHLVRHCLDDGRWNGTGLICIYDCDEPSVPTNGTVSFESTTATSVATYMCNQSYSLDGDTTRTCIDGVGWNGTAPVCHKDCLTPDSGEYTTMNVSSLVFGSTVVYGCLSQYVYKQGDLKRFCTTNGKWNGTAPVCIYDCKSPKAPANGNVTYNSTFTASSANYSCASSYTLFGASTRTCINGSGWEPEQPVCYKDCVHPGNITNGLTSVGEMTFGSNVTYKCTEDYFISEGDTTRTCLENGTWSGTEARCTLMECPDLSEYSNLNVTLSNGYINGSVATFDCSPGYHISEQITLVCVNKIWNGTAPRCIIKDCGVISNGTNSIVSVHDKTYLSNATYTCIDGYIIGAGDKVRTCLENGSWSGDPLSCVYQCSEITRPDNGDVNATSLTDGQTVTYSCNEGFTLLGSQHLVCIDGHGLNDIAPQCFKDCDHLSNGTHSIISTHNQTYLSNATYSCKDGYIKTDGDTIRTCTEDGLWSGHPLACVYQCENLTQPEHGSVNGTGGATADQIATYSCDEGYTLVGNPGRICEDGIGWHGDIPACYPDCGVISNGTNSIVSVHDKTYLSNATYTCIDGYIIGAGDKVRTCLENGSWSGDPLSCVYQCSEITRPDNGDVNATSLTDGQTVTYSCNEGFTLFGRQHVVCIDGHGLNDTAPECFKDCDHLSNGTHSIISTHNQTYLSNATYSCKDGYIKTDGDTIRTCTEDGLWSGHPLACVYQCESLTHLEHGSVNGTGGATAGQIATYSCDEGYTLVGNPGRTCEDGIGWLGDTPACYPDCPLLENTTGVMVTVNGTSYQSVATYTCTHGYEHVDGNFTRTCQANGTWSGSETRCLFDCGPVSLDNGDISDSGNLEGSTVSLACDEGYNIQGSSQRTCVEGTGWNGTTTICFKYCPMPENTTTASVTTDALGYEYTATYTCLSGYVPDSGDQTVTCLADGTWSGTALRCIFDCQYPAVHDGGSVATEGTNPGHKAIYNCNIGYVMHGGTERVCIEGTGWNGTVPECKKEKSIIIWVIIGAAAAMVVAVVGVVGVCKLVRNRKQHKFNHDHHHRNVKNASISKSGYHDNMINMEHRVKTGTSRSFYQNPTHGTWTKLHDTIHTNMTVRSNTTGTSSEGGRSRTSASQSVNNERIVVNISEYINHYRHEADTSQTTHIYEPSEQPVGQNMANEDIMQEIAEYVDHYRHEGEPSAQLEPTLLEQSDDQNMANEHIFQEIAEYVDHYRHEGEPSLQSESIYHELTTEQDLVNEHIMQDISEYVGHFRQEAEPFQATHTRLEQSVEADFAPHQNILDDSGYDNN